MVHSSCREVTCIRPWSFSCNWVSLPSVLTGLCIAFWCWHCSWECMVYWPGFGHLYHLGASFWLRPWRGAYPVPIPGTIQHTWHCMTLPVWIVGVRVVVLSRGLLECPWTMQYPDANWTRNLVNHCLQWATAPIMCPQSFGLCLSVHTNEHVDVWYMAFPGIKVNVWQSQIFLPILLTYAELFQIHWTLPAPNHYHAPGNRLKVVQWNASGMSLVKQDDVISWLLQQSIDIMVIVETRWTFTNE